SPSPSPTKRFSRPTIKYGDRYIPNREGIDLGAAHKLLIPNRRGNDTPQETIPGSPILNVEQQRTWEANRTFNTLLRAELFAEKVPGAAIVDEYVSSSSSLSLSSTLSMPARPRTPPPLSSSSSDGTGGNLFSFKSPTRKKTTPVESSPKPKRVERETDNSDFDSLDRPPTLYSSSVVRPDSQRLLLSPRRPPRRISNVPFKVLDAPELADDFYLNLVDWGQNNTLAVGLGSAVYLWNAASGQVSKLCDVTHPDRVTSVAWIEHGGNHLAIGCDSGLVQIWDATRFKRVRTMPGHTARVGCLAWRDHILSSGSRDRHIVHRDVRAPVAQVTKWLAHHQEVCGLEWNAAHLASRPTLASGGNDNRLMVWEGIESTQATLAPRMVWEFADNKAAVKALAWHPHQRGILASGGGTADGRIRFWNTSTGRLVTEIATGSQVCNLKWSKTSNELVSTHGYSRNHITVWKYPTLQPVATLTGHTFRVLYLSMSPDGQSIVTGAGDETLRFWQVFGKSR
ncbi:WD40 repeat-like protein, partial [Nadsonia fulvescens var. elongata DSM 6958]